MVLRAQLFSCLLNCQLCLFLLFERNPGTTTLREARYLAVGECSPLFRYWVCQVRPKAHPSERIWHMPQSVSLWSALPDATPATHPACFFLGFSQPPRPTKTSDATCTLWYLYGRASSKGVQRRSNRKVSLSLRPTVTFFRLRLRQPTPRWIGRVVTLVG